MLTTIILQTFIKDEYLQTMYYELQRQIIDLENESNKFNIFITQDNIKGYKKQADPIVVFQFEKVKKINNLLAQNENTTYLLLERNMHPSPLCAFGINYAFANFNCDYFIYLEDDLCLSENFLKYNMYTLTHLLNETTICVAPESIYFRSKKEEIAPKSFVEQATKVINEFSLEKYYIKLNHLPSTCFGSNSYGWSLIKDTRGNRNPTGATICNYLFKDKGYYTVTPIVPRCKDDAMNHDLGFSVLWHGKGNVPNKNTYLLSNYNKDEYCEVPSQFLGMLSAKTCYTPTLIKKKL